MKLERRAGSSLSPLGCRWWGLTGCVDFQACRLRQCIRVLGVSFSIERCHERLLRVKDLTKHVRASEELLIKRVREQGREEVHAEWLQISHQRPVPMLTLAEAFTWKSQWWLLKWPTIFFSHLLFFPLQYFTWLGAESRSHSRNLNMNHKGKSNETILFPRLLTRDWVGRGGK